MNRITFHVLCWKMIFLWGQDTTNWAINSRCVLAEFNKTILKFIWKCKLPRADITIEIRTMWEEFPLSKVTPNHRIVCFRPRQIYKPM